MPTSSSGALPALMTVALTVTGVPTWTARAFGSTAATGGAAVAVTATPAGLINPVAPPLSVRRGAVSPLAVRLYTVMELLTLLPTTSSSCVRSRATAAG